MLEEKWQQCIQDAIEWIQRVFTEEKEILLSKTTISSLLEKLNCLDEFSRFVRTPDRHWYNFERFSMNRLLLTISLIESFKIVPKYADINRSQLTQNDLSGIDSRVENRW